jgi:spermidine synthase
MSASRPKLAEIPSPWPFESGTVRLFAPDGELSPQQAEQLRRGNPGQPFILEEEGMRHLHFTLQCVQSSMDCHAPEILTVAYVRKMMAFLLFKRRPRHIVMIGLGGGSLAKFCYRHLPHAAITVVEIDEQVIALRDEFRIPADDKRFRVIHDDGAAFFARAKLKCDVVLIDAFDAVGIAPSFATFEFYQSLLKSLRKDGLLVMNFFGAPDRCVTNLKQLNRAFKNRILLVPVRDGGNTLAFAFAASTMPKLEEQLEFNARLLQQELSMEFPIFLDRLRSGERP